MKVVGLFVHVHTIYHIGSGFLGSMDENIHLTAWVNGISERGAGKYAKYFRPLHM